MSGNLGALLAHIARPCCNAIVLGRGFHRKPRSELRLVVQSARELSWLPYTRGTLRGTLPCRTQRPSAIDRFTTVSPDSRKPPLRAARWEPGNKAEMINWRPVCSRRRAAPDYSENPNASTRNVTLQPAVRLLQTVNLSLPHQVFSASPANSHPRKEPSKPSAWTRYEGHKPPQRQRGHDTIPVRKAPPQRQHAGLGASTGPEAAVRYHTTQRMRPTRGHGRHHLHRHYAPLPQRIARRATSTRSMHPTPSYRAALTLAQLPT